MLNISCTAYQEEGRTRSSRTASLLRMMDLGLAPKLQMLPTWRREIPVQYSGAKNEVTKLPIDVEIRAISSNRFVVAERKIFRGTVDACCFSEAVAEVHVVRLWDATLARANWKRHDSFCSFRNDYRRYNFPRTRKSRICPYFFLLKPQEVKSLRENRCSHAKKQKLRSLTQTQRWGWRKSGQ